MKILTISNLYPRPDQPQRGLFNAQLFEAMEKGARSQGSVVSGQISGSPGRSQVSSLLNICLVPEWRIWKWPEIRGWGKQYAVNSEQNPESGTQNPELKTQNSKLSINTVYLPVLYLPVLGRSLSWWTYLRSMAGLKDLVAECDVVFSTWLYPDGVAATLLADSCGRRSWIMVQGSDVFHLASGYRRKVILDACRKVEGIICVCKNLADTMINAGVEDSKVHVVPNGVNGGLFRYRSKEEAVQQLSVNSYQLLVNGATSDNQITDNRERITNNQCRIVLFVGNLVPVKGPDVLLEAWARLMSCYQLSDISDQPSSDSTANNQSPINNNYKQKLIPCADTPTLRFSGSPCLLIVGSGPMRKQLEKQAAQLGVADSILFLGSLPHNEVALWMNVADCLCLPSRSEGMPNVVIEALASGLPVVATDVGGVRELLDGEPAARITGSGILQADDIVNAIKDILHTEIDRKAIAERNRGKFSWDKQAQAVADLLVREEDLTTDERR